MTDITQAKRIVIKVGTSTLAHHTGLLNLRRVEQLVRVISDLKNSGLEIILVSSGAIGVGMGKPIHSDWGKYFGSFGSDAPIFRLSKPF